MKNLIKFFASKPGFKITNTKYIPKQFIDETHILKLDFDHVLSKYLFDLHDSHQFTFIQIGAFDGIECDPLRKYLKIYDWRGVLLEPQPGPFENLKKLYESQANLLILNAALDRSIGKTTLYVLEGDNFPKWAKGMASFRKQNILKHNEFLPYLDKFIKELEIDTITFEEIFNVLSIKSLDLLQIDTEGFDAEVLNMFPFDIIKPSIIHFESKHLGKPSLENLLTFLIENGYHFAYDGGEDMVALLQTGSMSANQF